MLITTPKSEVRVNGYGNTDSLPEGWLWLDESGWTRNKKLVQQLCLESGKFPDGRPCTILAVKLGWKGSRRWMKPDIRWAIHPDDLAILNHCQEKGFKTVKDYLDGCLNTK